MMNLLDQRGVFKARDIEGNKFEGAICRSCDADFLAEVRVENDRKVVDDCCQHCVPKSTIKGAWK